MGRAFVVKVQLTAEGDEDGVYARLAAMICDPAVAVWQVDRQVAGERTDEFTADGPAWGRADAGRASRVLVDADDSVRLPPPRQGCGAWSIVPAYAGSERP